MTKLLIINAIANHIFIGECKLKPWYEVSKAETTRHGAEQQAPLKKHETLKKNLIREPKTFL